MFLFILDLNGIFIEIIAKAVVLHVQDFVKPSNTYVVVDPSNMPEHFVLKSL